MNAFVAAIVRNPGGVSPVQQRAIVLFTMCLSVFIAQLDSTVVNLALKEIGADLGMGVSGQQWVVDAYNLLYACFLLTAGVLGERFGQRRAFNFGLALSAAGSLVCGLAPNTALLIAGRATAGLGASFVIPLSLTILSAAFPDHKERARAIGVWASCNALAQIFGVTAGGFAVDWLGWRSVFLLTVPVCVLGIYLAFRFVTESRGEKRRGLDLPGQLLAMLALGGLAFGFIEAPHLGWGSPTAIFSLSLAMLAAIAFVIFERQAKEPLIPQLLFQGVRFPAALAIAALMTFGMYAMTFLLPLYLQNATGVSAAVAGFEMLPMSILYLFVARESGKFAVRVGPRIAMTLGTAGMGIGLLILSAASMQTGVVLIEVATLIVGAGLGLNAGTVVSVAVAAVPESHAGIASGIVNTARIVGATLGVAILGAVYAAKAGQIAGDPAQIVEGFRHAMWGGAAVELTGTALVLLFIRGNALQRSG